MMEMEEHRANGQTCWRHCAPGLEGGVFKVKPASGQRKRDLMVSTEERVDFPNLDVVKALVWNAKRGDHKGNGTIGARRHGNKI